MISSLPFIRNYIVAFVHINAEAMGGSHPDLYVTSFLLSGKVQK